MAGITFVTTTKLEEIVEFYTNIMGMKKWLSQPDVEILSHGNLLLGFHSQKEAKVHDSLFCFFYSNKEEVDHMYKILASNSMAAPKLNRKYNIYHFFAKDPDNRTIEVQHFLDDINPINCDF